MRFPFTIGKVPCWGEWLIAPGGVSVSDHCERQTRPHDAHAECRERRAEPDRNPGSSYQQDTDNVEHVVITRDLETVLAPTTFPRVPTAVALTLQHR